MGNNSTVKNDFSFPGGQLSKLETRAVEGCVNG